MCIKYESINFQEYNPAYYTQQNVQVCKGRKFLLSSVKRKWDYYNIINIINNTLLNKLLMSHYLLVKSGLMAY